jgi:hypothetical protein
MRQVLIGDDVLSTAAGGIEAQVINPATGLAIPMAASMVYGTNGAANTHQFIRFIRQGAAGVADVVTSWIDGAHISYYDGVSGVLDVAQAMVLTYTNGAVLGNVTQKLIDTSTGTEPFTRYSCEVAADATNGNTTAANVAAAMTADIASGKLVGVATATAAANAVTVTGLLYTGSGEAKVSPSQWTSAFEDSDVTGTTVAETGTQYVKNSGAGNFILDLEKEVQGMSYGYYNRVELPNVPDTFAATGTVYDVYTLTWGNPSQGQIRGVDNLRDLKVCTPAGAGTWAQTAGFEAFLDNWIATVPALNYTAGDVAL